MIERDFIVAWRQNAPWPTDAQMEQDLVFSRALGEVFNHPLLNREFGPVVTALRDVLDPWLGKPKRNQGEGRMTLIYRFESELPSIIPLRLRSRSTHASTSVRSGEIVLTRTPWGQPHPVRRG